MKQLQKILFNKYTFLILVLLLGIGIGYTHKPTQTINTTEKEIVYEDSVVYVPKPYPVIVTKQVKIPVPYDSLVYVTPDNETLVKRKYRDVVQMEDSLSVSFTATTTGTLDSLSLTVNDTRPEKVVYRTKEVTLTKPVRGLFIGGSLSAQSITPSAVYQSDKNLFGIGYDVINKTPQISYHRRLF